MSETDRGLLAAQAGDSETFLSLVAAIAKATVLSYSPARIYMVRIDNWFGRKWLNFSGKKLGALAVYKSRVTIPPFVPDRVEHEAVFKVPHLATVIPHGPLHRYCTSEFALTRYIDQYDPDAAFVWFSSQSSLQQRGSVMVYSPGKGHDVSFYSSFVQHEGDWTADVVSGISRAELRHLAMLQKTNGGRVITDSMEQA